MTNEQIIEIAKRAGFSMENSAAIQAAEHFAQLVRNAALFEAMEVCIDQGELKDHDAMDCYYAIQRLKS